jgi:hypothetical protein
MKNVQWRRRDTLPTIYDLQMDLAEAQSRVTAVALLLDNESLPPKKRNKIAKLEKQERDCVAACRHSLNKALQQLMV